MNKILFALFLSMSLPIKFWGSSEEDSEYKNIFGKSDSQRLSIDNIKTEKNSEEKNIKKRKTKFIPEKKSKKQKVKSKEKKLTKKELREFMKKSRHYLKNTLKKDTFFCLIDIFEEITGCNSSEKPQMYNCFRHNIASKHKEEILEGINFQSLPQIRKKKKTDKSQSSSIAGSNFFRIRRKIMNPKIDNDQFFYFVSEDSRKFFEEQGIISSNIKHNVVVNNERNNGTIKNSSSDNFLFKMSDFQELPSPKEKFPQNSQISKSDVMSWENLEELSRSTKDWSKLDSINNPLPQNSKSPAPIFDNPIEAIEFFEKNPQQKGAENFNIFPEIHFVDPKKIWLQGFDN